MAKRRGSTFDLLLHLLVSVGFSVVIGDVWVGGEFQAGQIRMYLNSVGVYNNDSWDPLATGVYSVGVSGPAVVNSILYVAPRIFVAGNFQNAGSIGCDGLAYWHQRELRWYAFSDTFGSTTGSEAINALAYVSSSSLLVVGGCFMTVSGVMLNRIFGVNMFTMKNEPLGDGFNSCVNALIVDSQGIIFAGGSFWKSGTVTTGNVAWYVNGTWQAVRGSQLGSAHTSVTCLTLGSDGDLYAGGGDFVTSQVWKLDGDFWRPLTGIGGDVNGLATAVNGDVYVVGNFPPSSIAVLPANSTQWDIFSTGLSASTSTTPLAPPPKAPAKEPGSKAATLVKDPSPNPGPSQGKGSCVAVDAETGYVYVGGQFGGAGTVASPNIVGWDPVSKAFFALGGGIVPITHGPSPTSTVNAVVTGPRIPPYTPTSAPSPPPTPPATDKPKDPDTLGEQYWWLWILLAVAGCLMIYLVVSRVFKKRSRSKASREDLEALLVSSSFHILPEWRIEAEDVKILSSVGHGTSGTVYKAQWKQCLAAVKLFHVYEDLGSFTAEFRLLSRLHHPNVVQLYGIVVGIKDRYGLVMEYLENGNLYQLIHPDNPDESTKTRNSGILLLSVPLLPIRRVLHIALGIAGGMFHLHSQDPPILHRDLKPSNVLLGDGDIVKLADFGFSRVKADETMTFCGTPRWSAPEVLNGEHYAEPADVWSFGVIFWEMLSGQEPYRNSSVMKAMMDVSAGSLVLPTPNRASQQMAAVMRGCLQYHPGDRLTFAAVVEMLQEINQANTLNDLPLGSPQVDSPLGKQ